jgi:hypothetical protein
MADSLFELVAVEVEKRTDLDKLEARGTVRIALKEAGLDPRNVTVEQMAVMLERTLPKELETRGVSGAAEVCRGLVTALKGFTSTGPRRSHESPEDVFRRLGGR